MAESGDEKKNNNLSSDNDYKFVSKFKIALDGKSKIKKSPTKVGGYNSRSGKVYRRGGALRN